MPSTRSFSDRGFDHGVGAIDEGHQRFHNGEDDVLSGLEEEDELESPAK